MKKPTKVLLALLSLALIGAAVDSREAQAKPQPRPLPVPAPAWSASTPKLPTRPCPDDDSESRNCYWDAAKRGNGKGHSYFVDARGAVTYLNPKLNDQAARNAFALSKKRAGWEYWGVVFGHRFCWAKVGDTSYIQCFDGFKETS
ncbi:hypothetical protein [Streptomyces sp. NPDC055036]